MRKRSLAFKTFDRLGINLSEIFEMKFEHLLVGLLCVPLLGYAQPKDEYVFENGADNIVFVETLGLDMEQAFVPAGMYFGWLLSNEFQSELIEEVADYTITEFKAKESTGPKLFMTDWEGVLIGELMQDDPYRFTKLYYSSGDYEKDLMSTLQLGTKSIYTIEDTWENCEKVKAKIDERYDNWRKARLNR